MTSTRTRPQDLPTSYRERGLLGLKTEQAKAEGQGLDRQRPAASRGRRPRLHDRRRVPHRRPGHRRRPDQLRPRTNARKDNMNGDLEATKALNAALADAQGEFPTIGREKTVTVRTATGPGTPSATPNSAPSSPPAGLPSSNTASPSRSSSNTTAPAQPYAPSSATKKAASSQPASHSAESRNRRNSSARYSPTSAATPSPHYSASPQKTTTTPAKPPNLTVQSPRPQHRRAHHRTPNEEDLRARDKLTKAGDFTDEGFDEGTQNATEPTTSTSSPEKMPEN